jgi:uncharacterized membrane protein
MTVLILGLVLFLLPHSVRMLADGWRTRTLARVGRGTYMGIYSLVSLVGLGLVIYGFGLARQQPVQVWSPPAGMRHVAALLTLLAFVLIAAAYVPGNQIKARLHHPMVLGVKAWALAHLAANGNQAHLLLFGAFLAWGVWNFVASRRRDRLTGVSYPAGNTNATVITLVAGLGAWVLTAFVLHGWLIGVRPVG